MPTARGQAAVGPPPDLQQVGFPSLLENPWPPEMKIEIPGWGKLRGGAGGPAVGAVTG